MTTMNTSHLICGVVLVFDALIAAIRLLGSFLPFFPSCVSVLIPPSNTNPLPTPRTFRPYNSTEPSSPCPPPLWSPLMLQSSFIKAKPPISSSNFIAPKSFVLTLNIPTAFGDSDVPYVPPVWHTRVVEVEGDDVGVGGCVVERVGDAGKLGEEEVA